MKKAANFRHVFAVSFQTTGGSNKYAARRVRANDRTLSGTMQPTEASRTTTSIASVPRTRAERTRPAPQPTRVATTRAVANRAVAPLESRIRGAQEFPDTRGTRIFKATDVEDVGGSNNALLVRNDFLVCSQKHNHLLVDSDRDSDHNSD
ncbi:uncharacterized protein [Dermacentor albipictus]|uniref:uncharacterized protein isoform X4 n=1 Tax=Dermacentor albipictus TaxID=60249 RepID=UPI0038FCFE89